MIRKISDWFMTHRLPIIVLASVIVIITTYMLVLPAFTLTFEKAKEQGGISVESIQIRSEDSKSVQAEAPAKDSDESESFAAVSDEDTSKDSGADQSKDEDKGSSEDESKDNEAETEEANNKAETTQNNQVGQKEDSDAKETDEEEPEYKDMVLSYDLNDKEKVTVKIGKDAKVPEGATLEVSELLTEIDAQEARKEAFERGSEIDITEITQNDYDNYVDESEKALGWNKGNVSNARLLDIKIVDKDGNKVKIAAPVDVRIELADTEDKTELNVVHFEDGSEKGDKIDNDTKTINEGQAVEFEADGFSVYAVIEPNSDPNARMSLEFYSGSTKITTLYVKNGDTRDELEYIIYDPGAGILQPGEIFTGWILDKENYTSADLDDAMNIDQVRDWAEGHSITEDEHGPEVHKLYAAICKLYQVNFYDDDGTDVKDPTQLGKVGVPVKSSEYGSVSVPYTVNMAYTPKDDVHKFEGWILDPESDDNVTDPATIPADRTFTNGTTIKIKGDVDFTVNAPEGKWLIFDENGKGATYNAPQFVKVDEVTEQPCADSDMHRLGYRFDGWYDTKEHADNHAANPQDETGKFVFGDVLHEKTTLYASWIPNERAPYTIIIWKQNQNRTAYEVAGSYVVQNGIVGQNIPYSVVDNGDEDYVTGTGLGTNGHITGFSIKAADRNQQIRITPEGDAVLNLHFDRITYNLRFYLYRKGAGNNSYQYAQNSNAGKNVWGIATWYTGTSLNNMPTTTYGPILSEAGVDGYTGYYFVLSAYYGEDISARWPQYSQINGPANNRSPVSYIMMNGTGLKGNGLNDNGYGTGKDTIKGIITIMDEMILGKTNDSNGNYLVVRFNTYNNWRYHIWYETVDGEDYTGKTLRNYNGKTYFEIDDSPIEVRSSNTDVDQQNPPQYLGYTYAGRRNQNWNGDGRWTEGSLYHINYLYNRETYRVDYFDGVYMDGYNRIIQNRASHPFGYSAYLAHGSIIPDSFKNFVPPAQPGFVFDGWYLDEGCLTPYVWSTMTVGGIKVYAKWRQVEYRVFLHPNAGTDPSLDWGDESVSTSFRVAYGGKVSTPTGTRPGSGYEFVGWYTHPSLGSQYLYNSDTVLNEDTVTAPYSKTENTELDKWGHVKPGEEGNADVNRFWINNKLDLYAKWRKVLDNSEGISVVYTADDGKGNVGANPPTDSSLYPDQAEATAQAAATAPEGREFKHWVIQKWDEAQNEFVDTDEQPVLPGQTYTIKEEYAHKVEDDPTGNPGHYTYTMQLRAEYAEPESGLPTHIWWFNNYSDSGAARHDSSHEDEGIKINEAVPIQPAPTREGYEFLGWARVPTPISESLPGQEGGKPTGNVLDDVSNLLYLKYEDGVYKLNDPTSIHNGAQVTHVAADERKAYHDMYAVWRRVYTVTVKKVVVSGLNADKEIGFNFNETQTIDAESGTDTFVLHDSETHEDEVKKYENMFPAESTFSVKEVAGNGYNLDDFDIVVTGKYTDDEGTEQPITGLCNDGTPITIQGDTEITVTNSRKTKTLKVYKVDDSDTPVPLNGAVFTLSGGAFAPGETKTLTSGENGDGYTDAVMVLASGTVYTLSETTPVEHYIGLDSDISVRVNPTGITVSGSDKASVSGPDASGTYTITVVNPRERYKVNVIKNVEGVTTDQDLGFDFTATGLTGAATTFTLYGTETKEGDSVIHHHSKEFTDVPYGTNFAVEETTNNEYFTTSIEIEHEGGSTETKEDTRATGTVTADSNITITYTNKRNKIPLKVVKVDQDGNPLAGATFTGDLIPGGSVTTVITGTGSDAEAIIIDDDKVPTGNYTIEETGVPDGYIGLEGPVTIDVTNDGTAGDINVSAKINGKTTTAASCARIDSEHPEEGWIITIRNDAGVELPHTGGSGVTLIYFAGILMILMSGAALVIRRKVSAK